MSVNKIKSTAAAVHAFLDALENQTRRNDSYILLDLIQKITGIAPVLWGKNMVGFGSYHYKYDTGHEGDSFLAGFLPRK